MDFGDLGDSTGALLVLDKVADSDRATVGVLESFGAHLSSPRSSRTLAACADWLSGFSSATEPRPVLPVRPAPLLSWSRMASPSACSSAFCVALSGAEA